MSCKFGLYLKVKYYMNKILISENALTKWYLLGCIEFLATLKCLIIICCFLPAEFWQKYAEVSELTGHVRTSGNYGISLCKAMWFCLYLPVKVIFLPFFFTKYISRLVLDLQIFFKTLSVSELRVNTPNSVQREQNICTVRT